MTQAQVATIIGKTQQTVANWEAGAAQPDANTLFVLCDLYKISIDDTFGGGRNVKVTSGEMAIIEHYRVLDSYGKEAVTLVIDAEYRRCKAMGKVEASVSHAVEGGAAIGEICALIDLFSQASAKTREQALGLLSEEGGKYPDKLGDRIVGNIAKNAQNQTESADS